MTAWLCEELAVSRGSWPRRQSVAERAVRGCALGSREGPTQQAGREGFLRGDGLRSQSHHPRGGQADGMTPSVLPCGACHVGGRDRALRASWRVSAGAAMDLG